MIYFLFIKKSYIIKYPASGSERNIGWWGCRYLLFLGAFLSTIGIQAQVSGIVFRDLNSNGVKDNSATINEPFISGVVVKAFDVSGTEVGSTGTDVNGAYSFTGLTLPLRIEFSGLQTGEYSSAKGTGNKSSVQFYSSVTSSANFSIIYPGDYCQTNPKLISPKFINGSGVGLTDAGFISFLTNNSGTSPTPNSDIQTQSLGSTWGTAIKKSNKLVFASAFTKRHTGLGPRGADGVYIMDYSTATPGIVGGFDLQGVIPANGGSAIDLGTVTRTNVTGAISAGAAGDNQLSSDKTQPNRDLDGFQKVGKASFGDMDISEDEKTLWLVNLNQRAVIAVDISNLTLTTSNPNVLPGAIVNQYPVSNFSGVPTCTGGTLRPFALKAYKGKIYLGCNCDASVSGSTSDLDAYILSFDPANPVAVAIEKHFELNYTREAVTYAAEQYPDGNGDGDYDIYYQGSANWMPWISSWTPQPQPMVSDIEFDTKDNMTIGITDRMAHQSGNNNYIAVSGSTTTYDGTSAGDILKMCKEPAGWLLECADTDNNTSLVGFPAGGSITDGPDGNGEFYYNDYFYNNPNVYTEVFHWENSLGGLTLYPLTGEIATTVFDPINDAFGGTNGSDALFRTQGVRWYNTTDGSLVRSYQVVPSANDPSLFGKASGLGDLEIMCDPAPLEIGNRVWNDTDNDGIQDADENGISGVTVELVKSGVVIATANTDTNGNYYFSNGAGTSTASAIYNIAQFMPNMQYTVRIPNASGGSQQAPLSGLQITVANSTGDANADARDSDGTAAGSNAEFTFTTGNTGANDHRIDFGFKVACSPIPCGTTTAVKN